MAGITVSLSNAGGTTTTDASGSFLLEVAAGWSGTITPTKENHTFSPPEIAVSSISQDSLGHEWIGTRSNILYVDATASGSGDGSSWIHAYTDLGDALRATVAYDEVWVARGTYRFGSLLSFLIPPDKEVYVGFLVTRLIKHNGTRLTIRPFSPEI